MTHRTNTFILLAAAFLLVSGCETKNPVTDEEGHEEAVGLVITSSGLELVRYENGVVTGSVSVQAGQETPLLTVQFIDEHDGALFQPDEEGHTLGVDIEHADIAEMEQHAEDGLWRFHIIGKTAGTTSMEVKIIHEDHADFVSLPIPIQVTP
jgi:hypothetical protein